MPATFYLLIPAVLRPASPRGRDRAAGKFLVGGAPDRRTASPRSAPDGRPGFKVSAPDRHPSIPPIMPPMDQILHRLEHCYQLAEQRFSRPFDRPEVTL